VENTSRYLAKRASILLLTASLPTLAVADTIEKDFTIGQDFVHLVLEAAGSDNPSITVSNGQLNINVPGLQAPPYNLPRIAPITIQPITFVKNGTTATATCDNFSVDPNSITATFNGYHLDVSATGSGRFSLHIGSGIGSVNPTMDASATVTARISYSPVGDNLFLLEEVDGNNNVIKGLVANSWNITVSGCGIFGWCNNEVAQQTDLNNIIQSYATTPFNNFLMSAPVTQFLRNVMVQVADIQSPPPSNQTQWQYEPNSADMGNNVFTYRMSAVNWPATTPPPNCTFAVRDCSDNEFIYCNQVPNPITQRVVGATGSADTIPGQNVYTVPPGNYQVCDANAYNNTKACQSIPEPPAPPPSSCITCSPPCPATDICEIFVNARTGVCVPNHRCMVGHHFCGGKCVPGTGLCG
jgi:hypothetical protein